MCIIGNTFNPMGLSGYIYARTNELYDIHNCYKLGRTQNILERETNYITSEVNRGYFKYIYEIYNYDIEKCERQLFRELKSFNVYYDAGKEFYKKIVIEHIEQFFNKKGINYKILSTKEINELTRIKRENINEDVIEDDSEDECFKSIVGDGICEKIELYNLYGCEFENYSLKYDNINILKEPYKYQKDVLDNIQKEIINEQLPRYL